ncbi:g4199 [Coccomyxa elongata]
MATRSSAEPADEKEPCFAVTTVLQRTTLAAQAMLKKAVGDEVRVALREGSIEYHSARIMGRKDDSYDVVYQDLPGLREFIDRRSRRLWRGTLDEDGWEMRGIKYVPLSRAYAIDIDRTSGSPAGKQSGNPEARKSTAASKAWKALASSPSGQSDAQQQAEQANSKEAVLQHVAKLAAMRKAAPAHAAQFGIAPGDGGPAQSPPAMETAVPSSAAAEQPSIAGGKWGATQSLPPSSIPKASPPQCRGLTGPGLVSSPSLQHLQSGSGGVSGAEALRSGKPPAQSHPSQSEASCSGKPVADPPLVKKQKRTALEPGRAPKRQRSTRPLERGPTDDSAPARPASARPLSAQPTLGSTSSQPQSAPAARAAPRPHPAPAQFVIGIPSPQQPAGRPTASVPLALPVLAQARLAQPTSGPTLQLAPAQPTLAHGLPTLRLTPMSAPHIPPAVSLNTRAAREPPEAVAGAQKVVITPGQNKATVQRQAAVQADRESAALSPPQASSRLASTTPQLPSQGQSVSYGDWLVQLPHPGVDVDVKDMQRPFLHPSAMASFAEPLAWDTGMAMSDASPPGVLPEDMKLEDSSQTEDLPTPNPNATPEMSAADVFEHDGKEQEFMAALHSYLVLHNKAFYQPRIQTKPVSIYRLWKMVWEAGGAEAVTQKKGWARIARALGAPDSMTDKSTVAKRIYQLSLGDFEKATERGETNWAEAMPRDAAGMSLPEARQRSRAARPSPIRKRQRASGRASGRAAERRVIGWVQVNKEHALDVGASVEVRCYDKQHVGGWLKARILQVCQGSLWEGGLRFEVELEAETEASKQMPYRSQEQSSSEGVSAVAEEDAEGGPHDMEAARKERGWVPLVHAPANGEWPAVLIRQPLQPAVPPTPAVEWRVGERVEGEMWVLPSDQVRRGHSAEREGFGLLEPVQEAQWTTAENLRRKLAWKDHTVDGWTIESYSMQSAIPQAPVDSEGSPPSRLHNANRSGPAMDPLARLEEAATRVLGRTLSAATPRVETAAAGLLDLAPGSRGGAFSSAAESPCASQVLGEGPGEETFADNASDVSTFEEPEVVHLRGRPAQHKPSRLALPPLIGMGGGGLSHDEALEEGVHFKGSVREQPIRGKNKKQPAWKDKGVKASAAPQQLWTCPAVSATIDIAGFLKQKVPAATVDPFYSFKLEAAEQGTVTMQMGPEQQANMPASSDSTAEDDCSGTPPHPPAAPEAAAGPAAPAALVLAPAAAPSPPAKVHHWPVRTAKPVKDALKRDATKASSSAATQPPAPSPSDSARAHLNVSSALKSDHHQASVSPLPKRGQESGRGEKSPKQARRTGKQPRPGSTGLPNAGPPSPRPLLPATGLSVVGQPKGHAFDVPGGVPPSLPFWGHSSKVLEYLLQVAASQPRTAAAASVPYMLVPFSNDALPRQRPRALPRLAPRPLPPPIAARPVLPPRSGHRPGPAAALPPRGAAAPALPAPMARQPQQSHTRVPCTIVSAPGPTSAPGMYSQPAVAMRSLLASASEILNRTGAPGTAVERPMPALVNMPRVGALPPATHLPQTSLSVLDIQRAAESIAPGRASAAPRPMPLRRLVPADPSRPPYPHQTSEVPSHSPANAQHIQQPVSTSAVLATAGAPSLESRYPKIHFNMAARPAPYPIPSGGKASGMAPQQTANPGMRPGPPSSRLIAALSQSLDAVPAGAAQLPQLQPTRAAAPPVQAGGNSNVVTHSWPAKKTAGVPLPQSESGGGASRGA